MLTQTVMKKQFSLLFWVLLSATQLISAQSRGIKVGYIDMEYILDKVPSYAEAKNQLEQKAEKWKQEIETKKNDIAKLKEALKTEKVLLTKELISEREEEITFQDFE
jgi:Skp family chaperone for outer membrane proteins